MVYVQEVWWDEVRFILELGEYMEVKLVMVEGDIIVYEWVIEGGWINFDFYVYGGSDLVDYEKGWGKIVVDGSFIVFFVGDYGWFWCN